LFSWYNASCYEVESGQAETFMPFTSFTSDTETFPPTNCSVGFNFLCEDTTHPLTSKSRIKPFYFEYNTTVRQKDQYEELKRKLEAKCKKQGYQLPVFQKKQSEYFVERLEGNSIVPIMEFLNSTKGAGY